MYFIEQIIKIYMKLKKKPDSSVVLPDDNDEQLEDIVTCNHNFMPIDSTGNI